MSVSGRGAPSAHEIPCLDTMAATERHVRRETAPSRGPAVIDFEDVSKRYPSGDIGLDDVSFAIMPGEFVFLVGASGSGKSTTIRLLIKETEPTGGTIHVAGRDLSQISRRSVPYYRRNVGMVFQDYKLLPTRTVYENVAYALQVDRRQPPRDPRQGAGHPAPDRPVAEAPQPPRPALRRRAAARLGGARVRQPPAAAAGRRADRQPRSRDLDRDHAAALPHQPHRHDRRGRHPRRRDGRQDAPPRDRAVARAAWCATSWPAPTRRARRPASSRSGCART